MMKIFAIILLYILLQPVCVTAQKGFVKGELGEKLDDLMTGFGKEGYSGAVLVVQNDEIILHKGYGLADRERKIQNTPQTIFHVASIGKIFTVAAILHLEMRGKLKTTDLISKYLGEFPPEKNSATIHHLLTHTSGLILEGAPLKYESRKAFVQSVKVVPLESSPAKNTAIQTPVIRCWRQSSKKFPVSLLKLILRKTFSNLPV